MLNIQEKSIIGAEFYTKLDSNTIYTCIGYGQNPSSGAMFFIGTVWDSTNNRSRVDSFLLKDVTFKGNLFPKV